MQQGVAPELPQMRVCVYLVQGGNPVNYVVALAFTNGNQHGGLSSMITLIDTMTYETRFLYPVGHPARLR